MLSSIDSYLIPNMNHFLFVITKLNENYEELLKRLFNELWKRSMLNVIILLPISNGSLLLTTFFPYKEDCHLITRHDIEVFTNENVSLETPFRKLFPAKLMDFNGCELHCGVMKMPPYNIMNKSSKSIDEGININVLKLIAERYNFKLKFTNHKLKNEITFLNENGESGGLFSAVIIIYLLIQANK